VLALAVDRSPEADMVSPSIWITGLEADLSADANLSPMTSPSGLRQAESCAGRLWRPQRDVIRTLCLNPTPEARAVFERIRELALAS
jgi:hypothetical protein